MNGVLNVLKPPGMTSFDVVGYLRGVFKTKKIGHTGTLDPGAVGVLPVCIGNATKAIEFMMDKDKVYRAELTLGVATDTQDATGKILETNEVLVSSSQIVDAVQGFVGKYLQTPPMYSALKVDGKKLYELARSGITVEREAREVEIYSINIVHMEHSRVLFDVACSKGTYIRTLCADIGEKLGCGGHMSFLIRLKAGPFDISTALTLEEVGELAANGSISGSLSGVDRALEGLKEMILDPGRAKKLLNGVFLPFGGEPFGTGEVLRVYDETGGFLGLGEVVLKENDRFLKIKKVFI